MPSGRRSRQQRTVAAAEPRPRRASPRVLLGTAAVAGAIVVAVVLAVVVGGRSSSPATNAPTLGSLVNALPGAEEVDALFNGIPQQGTTLGAASAPVTMVEYVDLQCPYCAKFEADVLPDIVGQYVRTGKLKIVLRMWAFLGPDSSRGQAAVLAAARQNRAFNALELLYHQQGAENSGWLSDELVAAAGASIPGLRVHELLDARGSAAVKAQAEAVDRIARGSGITSTPTVIVGKSGTPGKRVVLSDTAVRQALDDALAS